jgi:putative transposase
MNIHRTNQVWALDTTYISMAKDFVCLTAVVDWASQKVLAANVAITLEVCHAVDVLNEAFVRQGRLRSSTPIREVSLPHLSLWKP